MLDAAASHYTDLWIHRLMLADGARCHAYRRAIGRLVRPGDVVLDVGAGTGILSLFAARAGARRVYAVERTAIAGLAERLAGLNGTAERIRVVRGDIHTLDALERVDVIVAEWMGGFGVDEGFLPAVVAARDRWLKPGGRVLPARVSAWMAPAWDGRLQRDLRFLRGAPYDLDLAPVAHATANELAWCRHHVTRDDLVSPPRRLWTTDVLTCPPDEARGEFAAAPSFRVSRAGRVNGLATWFRAEFGRGLTLTNAPDAPPTHWGRFVFPLNRAVRVAPGQRIDVRLATEPSRRHRWSVRIGTGGWEDHEGPA